MKHKRPEDDIQRAIVAHLRARGARGMVWWHTPNGGRRSPAEGAIFKSLGVRAGVADLILVHDGKVYALELKAAGGRISEAQREFLDAINSAGGFACCCEGLDRALAVLKSWGLLRGSSSLGMVA